MQFRRKLRNSYNTRELSFLCSFLVFGSAMREGGGGGDGAGEREREN